MTDYVTAPRPQPMIWPLLIVFAFVVSSTSVDPNDTWWHIRSGEYYLAHGTIPSTDVFSHTAAGEKIFSHEWLSQVILYGVYHCSGFVGIRVLNSIMAVLAILLLRRLFGRATDRLLPILFATAVIFPDFLGRMNTRPEIFTLPLMVGCIDFIVHRDRTKLPSVRMVLAISLIACLWANLHGMALLGLIFLVAYTVGEVITLVVSRRVPATEWKSVTRRGIAGDLILIAAISLAVLAGPMGYDIYVHAYQGRQFLPGPLGIMEWLSPFQFLGGILVSFLKQGFPWINIALGWQFLFIAIPLAYCFAVPFLAARRQLPTFAEILIVALAVYQGATVVRFRWLFFIPLFWIVRAIGNSLPRRDAAREDRRVPDAAREDRHVPVAALVLQPLMIVIMVCGIFMMATRGISFRKAINDDNYPVGIANLLEDVGASGNLFNSYNWGGYLIFRLWPNYRVFIDGRTDLYALSSRNLMLDHVTIENKEAEYSELLDRYNVDILLAMRRIYFPGAEYGSEVEFQRNERRRQFTGKSAQSAVDANVKEVGEFEPASASGSRQAWVPILKNREGSVYVRNGPAQASTIAKVKEFFAKRGITFDPSTGPDLATIIQYHPRLAVRYNIVSEAIIQGVVRSWNDESSDQRSEFGIQLAKALIDIELFRDGIAILEKVLEPDRYNNDALMLVALAHHFLGDNEQAYAYLERSATVGRNDAARALMQHCGKHQPPQSLSATRLPALEELVAKWKTWDR